MRSALAICVTLSAMISSAQSMPDFIRRFEADSAALSRKFPGSLSSTRAKRFDQFYRDQRASLNKAVAFDKLDREGQIDYILMGLKLEERTAELAVAAKKRADLVEFIPFGDRIIALDEELRQGMSRPDPRAAAIELDKLVDVVAETQAAMLKRKGKVSPSVAVRASEAVKELEGTLQHWFKFFESYDPDLTWWCASPKGKLTKALQDYQGVLRRDLAGLQDGDQKTIIGDPIGRDALLADLKAELIDYSPEELIQIAEKEFAWCEKELAKAAKEMGAKNGAEALERVKNLYVKPGEQPMMIRDMAIEAIDYFEKRDLLTVPPLAKETWRMEMLSAEAQLQSPFFLGGEMIQVSFPTQGMEHDAKMMSLRGNNPHFARATVHHELIPGHHLQFFYLQRYNSHRDLFGTPFWIEGWALYWEFMLWDMGFARNAEDKVGMLFWRMHRCARIVFSLKFHLGQMTPQECIDMLVDKVGHERENATAEVRRSFYGNYPPLYQAAYMLGALQLRALRTELVDSGKMKEKAFHDAILMGNEMPIAMVRARLGGAPLKASGRPEKWRFYPGVP